MQHSHGIVLMVALAAAVSMLSVSAYAQPNQNQPLSDTDIGITKDTIRIAVIADVDNAARPGVFQSSVNGVRAFGKYINDHGGLAGRKVQVDFYDSRLSADEAHNGVVRACQDDFAAVGTTALFLNDITPLTGCPDKTGKVAGLPDIPLVQTEEAHQCSPVSYPVLANQLVCSTKDKHPQTYYVKAGQIKYYLKHNKGLHGVWLIPGDLRSTINATRPLATGEQKLGIKPDADFFRISGLATQSDYTPIAQTIKQHNSTYAQSISDYKTTVFLRKESNIQGVNSVKVWDCNLQCYDAKFLKEGGADVEGQYAALFFIPFEEAKQNRSVAAFLKYVGRENADGFAAQAWAAGLFFRDVVNNIVKADGNNGLTRARVLEEAAKIHDFTAAVDGQGMLGATDVGAHRINPCYLLVQVKGGKYVRVFPKKTGTLDCNPKNVFTIKLDQT